MSAMAVIDARNFSPLEGDARLIAAHGLYVERASFSRERLSAHTARRVSRLKPAAKHVGAFAAGA
jgi:hypothetical protein